MDKSIQIISFTNHSPRFKPWAINIRHMTKNRFNGLIYCTGYNTNDLPEIQIDQLVYQLYGLTEEEIAIVENSNK